jgi:hypothetical protein
MVVNLGYRLYRKECTGTKNFLQNVAFSIPWSFWKRRRRDDGSSLVFYPAITHTQRQDSAIGEGSKKPGAM